jgi:hypothetical protein
MAESVSVKGKGVAHETPSTSRESLPRLLVRYSARMKLRRLYPLSVGWKPVKGAAVDALSPGSVALVVRPIIPGALVVPAEQTIDPTRPEHPAMFSVTLLGRGRMRGASVEVLQKGRKVQELPLHLKTGGSFLLRALVVLTLVVPLLLLLVKYHPLDGGDSGIGRRNAGGSADDPVAFVYGSLVGGISASPLQPLPFLVLTASSGKDKPQPPIPGVPGFPPRFPPGEGPPEREQGGLPPKIPPRGFPPGIPPPPGGIPPGVMPPGVPGRALVPPPGSLSQSGLRRGDSGYLVQKAVKDNIPAISSLTKNLAETLGKAYGYLHGLEQDGANLSFYAGLALFALTCLVWLLPGSRRASTLGEPLRLARPASES